MLGALAGVTVRVAAPDGYQLEPVAGAVLTDDPRAAADGADAVYTDVWVSMSDDPETAAQRREALAAYRLDDALLDVAAPRRRSRCTACPRIRARRSPPRSSTASASGSGIRPRTAATPRRRCSSC